MNDTEHSCESVVIPLPEGFSPNSFCGDCGDLISWCPFWCAAYPWLEHHR